MPNPVSDKYGDGLGEGHGGLRPVTMASGQWVCRACVMGAKANGGIFGEIPDLTQLDSNGSLRSTTDFRSVYATLLENWLGVDSSSILGGRFPSIPFIAA